MKSFKPKYFVLQVRAQSKELSKQIRGRVAREKHQQLRNIEEIKYKELLSWKEQHVNSTMNDYYYCLSNIGDAHVAAERENQLTQQLDEQQQANRKIAVLRGRKALQKERLKNTKKNIIKRKPKATVPKVVINVPPQVLPEETNDEILWEDDNRQHSDSDDEFTARNAEFVRRSLSRSPEISKNANEPADKQKTVNVVRFSQVSDLIEERRRARNVCDQILENRLDTTEPENTSRSILRSSAKSPQDKSSTTPKSPKQIKLPDQITKKSPVTTRGFMTRSSQSFRTEKINSENLKIYPQRSIVTNTKKVNTPKKVNPPKVVTNRVTKPKKLVTTTPPQRREFVPRFTKNPNDIPGILKNKTISVIPETATTETPEKVQFYDHFNRYGKEYDARPGMVQRESDKPSVSANEAAKIQNEMDAVRFQQLLELKYNFLTFEIHERN